MQSVILAAGRGSRMKSLAIDKPKCLLELAGKTILDWQIDALLGSGIQRITLITGYKAEKLISKSFDTIYNTKWSKSNMLRTLICANHILEQHTVLISYADIVYHIAWIKNLMKAEGDIVITYDQLWEDLWRLRFNNPLSDAESFAQSEGRLLDIGRKTNDLSEIQGQYMGLIKLTPNGWKKIQSVLYHLTEDQIDSVDMTALFQILLNHDIIIKTIPIRGRWCELDSENDLNVYNKKIAERSKTDSMWKHDWRN